jgi:XFP N-terminal domain
MNGPLNPEQIKKLPAYWCAANYLSVGQIYRKDNPLLERPLTIDDIKPRLLGHWGTTSGLNFIYVHLNRLITEKDLNMMNVIGPGHGGPGILAHTYLEGSYSETYPHIEQNRDGMKELFRQFSWPYDANYGGRQTTISAPDSRSRVYVLQSDEDKQIARHTYRLFRHPKQTGINVVTTLTSRGDSGHSRQSSARCIVGAGGKHEGHRKWHSNHPEKHSIPYGFFRTV